MADNGIRSKGGLYPHLRRLESANLISIRKRTTAGGAQLANEYTILDPYITATLNPSDYADFLRKGGPENDPLLEIKSLSPTGREI